MAITVPAVGTGDIPEANASMRKHPARQRARARRRFRGRLDGCTARRADDSIGSDFLADADKAPLQVEPGGADAGIHCNVECDVGQRIGHVIAATAIPEIAPVDCLRTGKRQPGDIDMRIAPLRNTELRLAAWVAALGRRRGADVAAFMADKFFECAVEIGHNLPSLTISAQNPSDTERSGLMQIFDGNAAWHVYPVNGAFEVAEYHPASTLFPRRIFEGLDSESEAIALVERRKKVGRRVLVRTWRTALAWLVPDEIEDRWTIRL